MIKKTRIKGLFLIVVFACITQLYSCKDSNKHRLDLSDERIDIEIVRLESDLFSVANTEDYQNLSALDSNLIDVYKSRIMVSETREGYATPEESAQGYIAYVQNPDIQHLYKTVDSVFPDLGQIEEGLSSAFTYYHHYFPDKTIPKMYSIITPFRAQNVTLDSAMAICLDMYLGADFMPYQTPQLQFPNFFIRRLRPDYIVPNAVRAWVESDYTRMDNDHRLLAEIIHQGKILYTLDRLMPDLADSLKIGYKQGQIEWCNQNEVQIWQHLIDEELLYSTEHRTYAGVVSDGPFSKGNNVPQDSPAKIGVWAGWQIVRAYMDKQSDVTLEDLLNDTNYDEILRISAYKP